MKTVSVMMLLLFSVYSQPTMAIEEPKYTVEKKTDVYEIRRYEPMLVAETTVSSEFETAGNQGFRILADFIFGNNVSQTKIAMTAPVAQTKSETMPEKLSEKISMTAPVKQSRTDAGFLVQFTMPSKYTLGTLPKPNDSRIQIREIPSRRVAVFQYSGTWSESRYLEKLETFRAALKNDGVATVGQPAFARFNSPFQLWFLRRNEIWLDVAP